MATTTIAKKGHVARVIDFTERRMERLWERTPVEAAWLEFRAKVDVSHEKLTVLRDLKPANAPSDPVIRKAREEATSAVFAAFDALTTVRRVVDSKYLTSRYAAFIVRHEVKLDAELAWLTGLAAHDATPAKIYSMTDERRRRWLPIAPVVKLTDAQKATLRWVASNAGGRSWPDGRIRFALEDRGLIRFVERDASGVGYEVTPLGWLVLESGQAATATKEG